MDEQPGKSAAPTIAFTELASPYTTYCVLCERAEVLADGSVTLVRIVNRWGLQDVLPPVAISFWIAIGFRNLTPRLREPIRLVFIQEDTQQGVAVTEPEIVGETSELNYLAEANGFIIHRLGLYRLSVLHGNREIGRFPFEIALDPSTADISDSTEVGAR